MPSPSFHCLVMICSAEFYKYFILQVKCVEGNRGIIIILKHKCNALEFKVETNMQ